METLGNGFPINSPFSPHGGGGHNENDGLWAMNFLVTADFSRKTSGKDTPKMTAPGMGFPSLFLFYARAAQTHTDFAGFGNISSRIFFHGRIALRFFTPACSRESQAGTASLTASRYVIHGMCTWY